MAQSALRQLVQAQDRLMQSRSGLGLSDAALIQGQAVPESSRLQRFTSLDSPQDMSLGETAADIVMGFTPGIGTAQGLRDFERARRDEDMLGMALGGLSAIPIAGGVVRAGKAAKGIHPAIEAYAANAGLDPRILQGGSGSQLSGPRVSDLERLQSLNINTGNQRIQEVPAFSIEDYEGYPIMSSMSDRAAAGDEILDINGVPVGVDRRGGQDFMFDPVNAGAVWASDAGVVLGGGETRMMNMAQRLKRQYGKDPLFAPWTMAPTGVDYSTMTGETMLRYAQNNMPKSAIRSLDKDMKSIFPDWQGISSPNSMQQFYAGSGDDRKSVIQLLDKKYRDKGSLTSGEARIAVTDAAQLRSPDGTLRNVGQIETSSAPITQNVHPTYNTALPGSGVGRLQSPVQVYELFPDAARLGGFDPMNPPRPALRALEMKPYSTLITEDLIRNIQARRFNQQ